MLVEDLKNRYISFIFYLKICVQSVVAFAAGLHAFVLTIDSEKLHMQPLQL